MTTRGRALLPPPEDCQADKHTPSEREPRALFVERRGPPRVEHDEVKDAAERRLQSIPCAVAAIEAQEFVQAAELRDRERELLKQALAAVKGRGEQVLGEVRDRLGLSEE